MGDLEHPPELCGHGQAGAGRCWPGWNGFSKRHTMVRVLPSWVQVGPHCAGEEYRVLRDALEGRQILGRVNRDFLE